MRFHLVYAGPLRASANKSKPLDVGRIRRALSPQLKHLWNTHHALQVLMQTGAKRVGQGQILGAGSPRQVASRMGMPHLYDDCLTLLPVGDKAYMPLVRQSLDLNCELQILFLRQDDPGALISQGGDLDGRIKTLLDALRVPTREEQDRAEAFGEDHLFCLMENDTLISRLDIDTDRLLFPQTDKENEVHLVIEVTLNVLRVAEHNMCLL